MANGSDHSRRAIPTPATVDEILRLYDLVREYDIHYSTVRSAVSTFLVTAVFGLDAWIVANTGQGDLRDVTTRVVLSSLLGPVVLLGFTLFISAHFQRLTICCQKIQESLERHLEAVHEGRDNWKDGSAVLFRRGIERLTRKGGGGRVTLRLFRADVPQKCLAGFTVLQVAASVWYWWPVLAP